jgi:trehalose synthase-fused probable maltokinase
MSLDLMQTIGWLPEQRWFGDKSRHIEKIDTLDHAVISEGDDDLILALGRVFFTEGDAVNYTLLLLRDAEGNLRDASSDVDRLSVFGELMAHGHPIKAAAGVFHFSGAGLDPSAPPGGHVWSIGAEQSNTSVVMDDAIVLKFFRKVEPGPNPDLELTRLLTNEGFDYIPPQVGEIFYETAVEDGDAEGSLSYDLGIAQQFAGDGKDGWDYVLAEVSRVLGEVHPHDAREDIPTLIQERGADCLQAIEQLGDATGSLHVLLSREEFGPELLSEEMEIEDLKGLSVGAQQRLDRLALRIPELADLADRLTLRLENITLLADAGQKTRVHGDYHLGQVLRVPRSWLILDFEGEPARRLEERRAKQSPIKDVAGMLRSFSYATYSALFGRCQPDDDEWAGLEEWALAWEAAARERFLIGYLTASHEGRFLPAERASIGALVDFFELDKALYEVDYEVDNRPGWLRIPLQGIRRVIERGDDQQ